MVVIPNGVEPPGRVADRPEGEEPGPLLYLGRISWKKGLERLIAALPSIPGVELLVAGSDDEGLTPGLRRIASQAGVEGRVRFVGQVDGERKERLFAAASMLVLPSYSENFGNVVLEAMARRLAVVVTEQVGLADVVEQAGCGIVCSGDTDSLAAHIASLLSDTPRRLAMGSAGERVVRSRFTWERVARSTEALYRSVLAPQSRCR